MAARDPLEDIRKPLCDLVVWLKSRGVPHVIVGGVAACLQGQNRTTDDIDAVVRIPEAAWAEFLRDAEKNGFRQRPENSLAFAKRSRVLLLIHPTGVGIDLSLGALPFEEHMIATAGRIRTQGVTIPVAKPEDLIIMKSLAMRPHDISDIETLLAVHPKLDLAYMRKWIQSFAEALDDPEIYERIAPFLLRQTKKRTSSKRKKR